MLPLMLLALAFVGANSSSVSSAPRRQLFTPADDSACSYFAVVDADQVPDSYDLDLTFYKKVKVCEEREAMI